MVTVTLVGELSSFPSLTTNSKIHFATLGLGVTVTPKVSVFKCVFELVVSDGQLLSTPTNVTVTIVPNYGSNVLVLNNPPFDSSRPTIVSFGGGNCSTGNGMTFGGVWDEQANWITVNTYAPPYAKYGDMLMVYLPKEKILINADLYTPPAAGALPAPTAGIRTLYQNVLKQKLDVARHVPVH